MTRISLLPPEINIALKRRKRQRLLILAGASFLLFFVLVYGFFMLSTVRVEAQLQQVKAMHTQVKSQINALQEYVQMQNRVETVENVLQEAMGSPPGWSPFLLELAWQFPPEVYLNGLYGSRSDSGGEITISGFAPNYGSLSNLIEVLQEMPALDQVRCNTSSATRMDNGFTVNFEITAQILPGEPYTLPREGGELK